MSNKANPPNLSLWQIWNMSFGFLGIQYGFGLQQANLSPIFRYLGAPEDQLPILWLAGPITGLLFQPIVGALSDRTWTRFGRRKPYFMVGALIGSVAVMFMPYVPLLWMAVGLFWILDAAMNTAMEPYRAMIGDNLNSAQRPIGFSVQSFMIAVGQIMAGLMPMILLWFGISSQTDGTEVPEIIRISFVIGVVAILVTSVWTFVTTKERPPTDEELALIKERPSNPAWTVVQDIYQAAKEMPLVIRRIWWVKLATWFAMPLMWQYLALSIARHSFNAPTPDSPGFAEGSATVGIALTVMNLTTLFVALTIPLLSRRFSNTLIYSVFLMIGGAGFASMLLFSQFYLVLAAMVLVGVGWAAIITIPFIITASVVPLERMGVYMGLLNAFICIPQIISMVVVSNIYGPLLGDDPRNAIVLAGACLFLGGLLALRIPNPNKLAQNFATEASKAL